MEGWISNATICNHLGVSRNTLYLMRRQGLFAKGTHWRNKDPLNKNSHKVWRLSAVDQLLSQPEHVLRRRVRRNTREISG